MNPTEEINITQAEILKRKGSLFLDVRSKEEIGLGYIPEAKHAELSRVVDEFKVLQEQDIPGGKHPIVVYCRSGVRSLQAVTQLEKHFPDEEFLSLIGGIEAWQESGKEISSGGSLLSETELKRYSRQIILPEIGLHGQEKLKNSRILIVGVGGLGSPASLYLAAAGISLGLIDLDSVEESNLQRQIVHSSDRIGQDKTKSAKASLLALNPEIKIEIYNERLSKSNAKTIIQNYDLVIDGTDNFPTRYLLNDVTQELSVPVVSASIVGFTGQVTSFLPGNPSSPCYRCLYPEPPPAKLAPSCSTAGVLGAMAGTIGSLQATEAVKILLDIGKPLIGRLFVYDALTLETFTLQITADPACLLCGSSQEKSSQVDLEASYKELCFI